MSSSALLYSWTFKCWETANYPGNDPSGSACRLLLAPFESKDDDGDGDETETFITAIPKMPACVPVHPGNGGSDGAMVAVTACGCGCGCGWANAMGDAYTHDIKIVISANAQIILGDGSGFGRH